MTIEKKVNGDTVELCLNGWMDTQSAPKLAAALDALEPGTKELIFNLSGLEYTSSAGIRQIVVAHNMMKGALTLIHVSTEIMDVLHLTTLDRKLHIEP